MRGFFYLFCLNSFISRVVENHFLGSSSTASGKLEKKRKSRKYHIKEKTKKQKAKDLDIEIEF